MTGAPGLPLTPDVVVVGAGPAGAAAAAGIAEALPGLPGLPGRVLVLERQPEATGHAARAAAAGAVVRAEATVTGWAGPRALEVTTPQGLLRVDARAVVLATGARERPRAARLIPGDRPAGVCTTGQLRRLVAAGQGVGTHAVVAGTAAAAVWPAVRVLRAAGSRTVLAATTDSAPAGWALRALAGVPTVTRCRISRVIGRGGRLQGVEIENTATGQRRTLACDCLVLTGDWLPENELARAAGLDLTPGGDGTPLADTALRASRPGVFAAGTLLHPGWGSARAAARDGVHLVAPVTAWLAGRAPAATAVPILAHAPLRWVTPALLRPGDPPPPYGGLLAWADRPLRLPRLTVRQDDRILARRTLPPRPGPVVPIPWRALARADREGGPVHLRVTDLTPR
ncbi:FAD-dependent oxidoreductase [Streptomyces sp. 6N223]|uniref:FAD-dependent oxidoreductase n=1 Tax=Streptomyces sp. 6N223 TaxID=3457412 RepID=UPI003FD6A317